jgi:hypothetical protein
MAGVVNAARAHEGAKAGKESELAAGGFHPSAPAADEPKLEIADAERSVAAASPAGRAGHASAGLVEEGRSGVGNHQNTKVVMLNPLK